MKFQLTVRGIVFSALFAALLVVFGFLNINLGFTPVPITLATLAIMLAGAFLGAGYGFFSVFLVIVLATLGLPFIGGTGGLAVILGPSAGFVWSWPFAALLIGYFMSKIKSQGIRSYVLSFLVIEVFGSLIMYFVGVPWLAHVLKISFSKAMVLGCYPYLPGDVIKSIVATLIVVPIRKIYPSSSLIGTAHTKVVTLD
jgi:biotin transport system substrate-specific component